MTAVAGTIKELHKCTEEPASYLKMLQYAILLFKQDKEETNFHLDVTAGLEVGWG